MAEEKIKGIRKMYSKTRIELMNAEANTDDPDFKLIYHTLRNHLILTIEIYETVAEQVEEIKDIKQRLNKLDGNPGV